jgi:hypothetical protein
MKRDPKSGMARLTKSHPPPEEGWLKRRRKEARFSPPLHSLIPRGRVRGKGWTLSAPTNAIMLEKMKNRFLKPVIGAIHASPLRMRARGNPFSRVSGEIA